MRNNTPPPRSLKTKFLFLLALLLMVYLIAVTAFMIMDVEPNFEILEKKFMESDLHRLGKTMENELEELEVLTRDYANWDDTWNFCQGKYPEYASVNLVEDTFVNARLSGLDLRDRQGKSLFFWSLYPSLATLPDPIAEGGKGNDSIIQGFVRTGDLAQAMVSLPVLHSDGSGLSAGRITMFRVFDDERMDALRTRLGMDFQPVFLMPEALIQRDRVAAGSTPNYTWSIYRQSQDITGTVSIHDLSGKSFLSFILSREASTSTQGKRLGQNIIHLTVLLAAFLAAGLVLLLRSLIIHPLGKVQNLLQHLDADNPLLPQESALNHMVGSSRELDLVIRSLLDVGQRLRESHHRLSNMNAELELQVQDRTKDLAQANRELTLYLKIMEETSEGVLITSLDGCIIDLNESMCKLSGYSREELLGQNPRIMKSDRHPEDFYLDMWKDILEKGEWSGEIWDRRKDGSVYPKWMMINTIRDDAGKPINYVGLSSDISLIKDAEVRLNQLAFFDSLTGLPNRILFHDRLQQALIRSQRHSGQLALIFLDLDRFKHINDTFGHAAGDTLLIEAAQRLRQTVRSSDTVCRLGGDEFTIILEGLRRSEEAVAIAEKIIKTMSGAFSIQDHQAYVGASIGIALCPEDGQDVDELLKKADIAMYRSKEDGRNRYSFYTDGMNQNSRMHLETESNIRQALDEDRFEVFFQPQAATGGLEPGMDAGLVGAEALVRWVKPDGTVVNPSNFIGIAEETGLIVPIGAVVFRKACAEAKLWADSGRPLKISVNASPVQLESGALASLVREALKSSGLDPQLLTIEVTESLFMKHMDTVLTTMVEIRSMGVKFAIDDFGTGFSSLKYLKNLPIDALKIDKTFVDDLADTLEGGEIVTAVISLARAFGLVSVAEGVETTDQLDALKRRGCDEIQGYLLGKPMHPLDFRRFIGVAETGKSLPI